MAQALSFTLAGVAMGFTVAVPAGTQTLAVSAAIGVDNYRLVGLTCNWNAGHIWWRSLTASGFTLQFANPPVDADGVVHGRIEL